MRRLTQMDVRMMEGGSDVLLCSCGKHVRWRKIIHVLTCQWAKDGDYPLSSFSQVPEHSCTRLGMIALPPTTTTHDYMKALMAAAASVSTPPSSLHFCASLRSVPPHPDPLSCLLLAFRQPPLRVAPCQPRNHHHVYHHPPPHALLPCRPSGSRRSEWPRVDPAVIMLTVAGPEDEWCLLGRKPEW